MWIQDEYETKARRMAAVCRSEREMGIGLNLEPYEHQQLIWEEWEHGGAL